MKAKTALVPFLWLCAAVPLSSFLHFDHAMTDLEQKESGIITLTPSQKQFLEEWINRKCTCNEPAAAKPSKLYVSEVIEDGQQIRLSDNNLYAIAPSDQPIAALWIGATAIEVTPGEDPDFPLYLTNTLSGSKIKAHRVQPTEQPASESPTMGGEEQ